MTVEAPRLAFDLALYKPGEARQSAEQKLGADLSTLVLETAARQDERITYYTFCQTSDGKIVSPEFSQKADISSLLRWETQTDILESKATLKIRDYILVQKAPFVVVWISPPEERLGYTEGRMVVGIGKEEERIKIVENYGVCLNCSSTECLNLANRLLSSLGERDFLDSPELLRASPIFISPEGIEPLDLMSRLIPLPCIWEKIKSGEAKALRQKAIEDARNVAQEVTSKIKQAQNKWELVKIGAFAEQKMGQLGWEMRSGSGCGWLNTELLSGISIFGYSHFHLDHQGTLSLRRNEAGVFVKKCPFCGAAVNRVIRPGYQCSCGKVYQGVC